MMSTVTVSMTIHVRVRIRGRTVPFAFTLTLPTAVRQIKHRLEWIHGQSEPFVLLLTFQPPCISLHSLDSKPLFRRSFWVRRVGSRPVIDRQWQGSLGHGRIGMRRAEQLGSVLAIRLPRSWCVRCVTRRIDSIDGERLEQRRSRRRGAGQRPFCATAPIRGRAATARSESRDDLGTRCHR